MFKFFAKLFDDNQKTIDKYQKIVDRINELESFYQDLSDSDLKAKTADFKKQISSALAEGQTEAMALDAILPDAFATVREASRRVLNMRHFDVQLLAGVALHNGYVTEQKTGEGKTLTVTAPLYLNALLGKGAHLITVNDYLSEIGAGWMGQIYHFLGLSTAVITHDKSQLYNPEIDSEERGDERLEHFEEITRREAYLADITYGTNNEFGFDYLRDNMVQDLGRMVQRQDFPHFYTIVDEADSILIDEARTPLIISAPDSEPTQKYYDYARMINNLVQDTDYKLDEKAKSATLTDLGVKRIEQRLGVKNLYEENFETIHFIENALKAKALYHRDKEYIVRDNEVIIVDEHTGRLMFGRRYSDGLHQSIEAKEGVKIQQESRTLATISLQNYFRLYKKLAGMTGTAATEAEEFKKIYNMDVLVVPTNKPIVREDKTDIVYKTTAAKYSAITKEIEEIHQTGRPILLGTRSIEHNQIISNHLKKRGIKHEVLNAKNNEREAFIIAEAGKKGAITVATNIAGRGVDIVLGGAKPELKDYRLETEKTTARRQVKYDHKAFEAATKEWEKANAEVIALGGLHILGTERHESRRIDNQLRGRSGRQGDPGSSQFFVSLEDEIMRIFGGEQISKLMDVLNIPESQPIEASMVSKAIENSQIKVEGFFFDQRKRLVDFDDVMNKHREIIYSRRRRLLNQASAALDADESLLEAQKDQAEIDENEEIIDQVVADSQNSKSLKEEIMGYVTREINGDVNRLFDSDHKAESAELLVKELVKIIPFDDQSQFNLKEKFATLDSADDIIAEELKIITSAYDSKEKQFGSELMREVEKMIVLTTIDEKWMDHLDQMDDLREGIWLRGDKNTALTEYKKEAFEMFADLIQNIESSIISKIFRITIRQQGTPVPPPQPIPINIKETKEDINEPLAKEVVDATLPSALPDNRLNTSSKPNAFAQALAAAQGESAATEENKPKGAVAKHKIGRNDLCYCGSGKKYKKCHMLIDEA